VANSIYPLWKQALMSEIPTDKSLDQGGLDPLKGVYISLVSTDGGGYVYSDAHQYFTDITSVVGTPQLITTPTVAGKVFSGDTVVFTNVTGPVINAFVLYRSNAGASSTWRLVLYEDTGIIGLPFISNGGNIIVSWNVQGIFAL
jgi:hypothetical protein